MMKHLITASASALTLAVAGPAGASELEATYQTYDRLLAAYVEPGADGVHRVDYARWGASEADRAALEGVVNALEQAAPSAMARDEAFAYWVNLYNADTLLVILEHYPVESIRDINSGLFGLGVWKMDRVTVESETLSLGEIEHEILRKEWSEPRVHYALNCASVGCPDLKPTAWRAASLEADLDAAARAYVNHPRGVSFNDKGRMTVSRIYKWFLEDFGDSNEAVIAHLTLYAEPDKAAAIEAAGRIAGHAYDWSLNETQTGDVQ